MGSIAAIQPTQTGLRLLIDARPWAHSPAAGDSISLNGCCLTLASPPATTQGLWAFDAVPETLAKTTLGRLKAGSRVNLEHAATASTLMGGHMVQGHVDGVGAVLSVQTTPEYRVRVRPPPDLMEFLSPKGSVCLEGVSLTIAALNPMEDWFEVALIPMTLEKTTLAALHADDECNVEADSMAKTIVHWLRHYGEQARDKDS